MLLPDPQRRGEIHFKVAKALPYATRLALIVGFLVVGFAVQALGSIEVGAALLVVATLLSLVRGYTNVPEKFDGKADWRSADRKELDQVLEISRKTKKWDQSLLDITCPLGLFGLIAAGAAVILVEIFILNAARSEWLARVWLVDCVVLLLPHWVTGVRRMLTNAPLVVKIEHLLAIMDEWERAKREGEAMSPQMEVISGKGGELPKDAKLLLRFTQAGDDFLGLQVQCNLNNVQGTDYPYLYCVLVARPPFGLLKRPFPSTPSNITVEPRQEKDVQIIVIRQYTTKTSGYHTNSGACLNLFRFALQVARQVTAARD